MIKGFVAENDYGHKVFISDNQPPEAILLHAGFVKKYEAVIISKEWAACILEALDLLKKLLITGERDDKAMEDIIDKLDQTCVETK